MNTIYQELEDSTLIKLVQKNNIKPLEIIYKRHYNLLFNYGLKYYSDEETIKDCIQDLFINLCTASKWDHITSVKAYLLCSLKNILINKITLIKGYEQINELTFNIPIDDNALNELFKNNDKDLRLSKKLTEAYQTLPENQRIAIYLRYIKELSYKEIATVLEIKPQSSMNLVSRALTKMRMKLSPEEYFYMLTLLFSLPK